MSRINRLTWWSAIALAAAALGFAACGCGGAAPPAVTARATQRSAAAVAKDAWVLVAQTCVSLSQERQDDSIRVKCGVYLVPAHDLILVADDAVDTQWSTSAACELVQATGLVASAAEVLGASSPQVKAVATDAAVVAKALAGAACAADGGAE